MLHDQLSASEDINNVLAQGGETTPTPSWKKVEYGWRRAEIARRERLFPREHQELCSVYGNQLPKVEPTVQVVSVVPAYRELRNNNFWRLLDTATRQGDIKNFEIIYVVNNTLQDAQEQSVAFKENQTTLDYLEILNKSQIRSFEGESISDIMAEIDSDLQKMATSDHEKAILKRAIERQVRFFGVDASSPELAISEKFNPRGQARNIGGHVAYERLKASGKDYATTLIDFLDADCSLTAGYYNRLITEAKKYKVIFKSLYAIIPDISEYVEKEKDPIRQLAGLIQYLKLALIQGRSHYLANVSERGDVILQTGHGPSTTISPELFREVGGYANDHGSEDFVFNDLILAITSKDDRTRANIRVNLSHRSREESVDGSELAKLDLEADEDALEYLKELNSRNIGTVGSEAGIILREIRARLETMLKLDAKYSKYPEYLDLRAKEFAKEKRLRRYFLQIADQAISSIVKNTNTSYQKDDIQSEYEWLVHDLSADQRDLLLANPSLIEAILTAMIINGNNIDKIKYFFKRHLPEYFLEPPNNEPDYKSISRSFQQSETALPANSRDLVHLARAIHLFEIKHQLVQDK